MNPEDTNPEMQDALMKSAALVEDLLVAATQQEQTIAGLKAANDELRRKHVVLEKVASERPLVSSEGVDNVVNELVASGYFSADEGVKCAAELKKSPDNLLKLASTLIKLNNPPQEGTGVPRTQQSIKKAACNASEEWELDGWMDALN